MNNSSQKTPITTYFFIILLVVGVLTVAASFIVIGKDLFNWMQQIGSGLVLIGIGEWINHPEQKGITYEDDQEVTFKHVKHRNRQPSSLGNLLEIVGLLLIFIGLADLV